MNYSKPVQEAVNYINNNITTDISLEALAELTCFSPYHFHRMFLLYTGEAPMEYIRRLRLRKASRELLMGQSGIVEIALKYRFESQDGFCRAFKKYYGITPGDYRKLNFKKQSTKPKQIEEADAIMYDINIYERLICSNNEKYEALNTLDRILELSAKTKNSGLLSLEPEINRVQPEFFKKSIQMLIDGIEPESLKAILLNYTLSSGCKGKELLTRILIIEGILAIQQGVNTFIIRENLSSFFGEDFIEDLRKHFGIDDESQQKRIDYYIIKIQDKPAFSKETSLLEEPFSRMDGRSLQRLLREFDIITLASAISGSSNEIQAKVLKHVSKRIAIMLVSEIEMLDTLNVSDIKESQKQVLEIMNSLRNQGDIVI
jgi:AraC-like DNA-binding protein